MFVHRSPHPDRTDWAFARVATPSGRAKVGSLVAAFTGEAALVVSGVIAARMLGPEDRGLLALLVLVPLALAQVGTLGLPLAVRYEVARDHAATAAILAALRGVVSFQAGLLTGLHCVILWALLRDESQYVIDAALVTIPLVPAHLAQEYGLAILRGRGRFLGSMVLRAARGAVYAGAVVVLFVRDIDGLSDVARVWTAANLVIGLLALAAALKGIGRAGDAVAPPVRSMLSFGLKGLFGAGSEVEHHRVDQAAVWLFLTPRALGIYAAALVFTSLPRFISSSIGMFAHPRVTGQRHRAEARRQLWRFFLATIAACLALVAALELAAGRLVPFLLGDAFEDSIPLVRIVLLSALLIAARRILGYGAQALGLPRLRTVAEIVSLVTLFPALAVFMPLWGVEGVAFALVVAGLTSLAVMLVGLAREARQDAARYSAAAMAERILASRG